MKKKQLSIPYDRQFMAEDYLELQVTLQSIFYYKDFFFLGILSNVLDIIINGKLYIQCIYRV